MKKLWLILAVLFFGQLSFAQAEEEEWPRLGGNPFIVQTGLWMPLGSLKNNFSRSPYISVGVNAIINHWRYELGVNIILTRNVNAFDYAYGDTSFVVKGDDVTMGGGGLRVSRIRRLSRTRIVEATMGLGYTDVSTGVKRLRSSCEDYDPSAIFQYSDKCEGDKKYKYYSFGILYTTVGIGIREMIYHGNMIGVTFDYRFSPYALTGHVKKDFGHSSLLLGLSYQF